MKLTAPLALISAILSLPLAAAEKPNVIIIFTDDHGYSDLSCQGIFNDVRTPHIDALARGGARMSDGYSSAPQCVPSRAGLMSGQYQNKFGLESNTEGSNPAVMDRFGKLETVAERLKKAGYATGMAGKWHLGPGASIPEHGFDKILYKNTDQPGLWNMDFDGEDIGPSPQIGGGYHLDLIADFACTFIDRYKHQPFFFYLACRAPHVPLDAPQKYLDRFPGEMPERRRQALAMLSAVDDGVGRINASLRKHDIEKDTLIFVIGDNGAPLKIHKIDAPGGGPGWDGSLNDPLNGEKGMLTEGGIRTPFVAYWKGTILPGQVYKHPVISLDATATALAIAGLPADPQIDGVNLIPFLSGKDAGAPHEALFWRWVGQSAIRKGKWKYLRGGGREYLFDLDADKEEKHSLLASHRDVADRLHAELEQWGATLSPAGLDRTDQQAMTAAFSRYFDWYLDGKRDSDPEPEPVAKAKGKPARKGPSEELIFKQRDKDKDGKVTLEEFIAGRSGDTVPTIKKNFARRDADGDGVWEKSEVGKQ